MQYFECTRPAKDGTCSDNACPCGYPGAKIPRGTGYFYISKELVEMRSDALTIVDLQIKLLVMQHGFGAAVLTAGSGVFMPILMCELGAKKRGLDLQVAADDATHWWKTGMAPLRPTPMAGKTTIAPTVTTTAPRKEPCKGCGKMIEPSYRACPHCGSTQWGSPQRYEKSVQVARSRKSWAEAVSLFVVVLMAAFPVLTWAVIRNDKNPATSGSGKAPTSSSKRPLVQKPPTVGATQEPATGKQDPTQADSPQPDPEKPSTTNADAEVRLQDTNPTLDAGTGPSTPTSGTAQPVQSGEAGLRTWVDVTGKHKTRAKYLGVESGFVSLQKESGMTIRLPLDQLSESDQQYVSHVTSQGREMKNGIISGGKD